ncbi:DUF447 domain-containing protein [Natronolimnobius baerhuensis]|uniref:DUF447 domain-containing protein n=1 Tax=Natronolimnobius baerhuensis TaxID=253108 RepID=A0A202E4S1_9EURY|nr:DUF447 domain-containing protein [Natronolimnobius baerhuensis]OVE83262.1 hypothetical protein B2G88_17850 [Natronolimnobius baerhuensis]
MTDAGDEPPAETDAEWPVDLAGVTETVVTTRGPNELWNAAALGVFAGADEANAATATTWGNTRTRRNFHREGEGYVQFVDDPITFVNAALTIDEHDDPVLEHAAAWTRVAVERIDSGTENGTEWEQWRLEPLETTIKRETVPTISRGFGAVIEATVATSRLGVAGYDDAELRDRLAFFESVVERAGSPREQAALERVREHAEW